MDLIKKYYRNNLKRYGPDSHEAVGWEEMHFQQKRFEYLAQIGNLHGKSVLDFGSGLGDFYGYLEKQGIGCTYTGLEMVPELISAAQKKHPNALFVERETLQGWKKPVDYIFASGTFNVCNGLKTKDYFDQVFVFIQQAFQICREGVAVNFLNQDLADWDFEFEAFLISATQVKYLKDQLKPRYFKNIIDPELEGEYTLHFIK